jgi:hypothetical protein
MYAFISWFNKTGARSASEKSGSERKSCTTLQCTVVGQFTETKETDKNCHRE